MKPNNIAIIYPAYRLTHIFSRYKSLSIPGLFALGYLGVFIWFLSSYFITDYTIWAVLALSPYITTPNTSRLGNFKYLRLTLAFMALTFISGVQTFYFLAIGLAILFVIESFIGKIGYLPLFLLGLLSPTFKYFNNMMGFPVRLKLSEWTGDIMQVIGYKTKVIGNVIVKNGIEFSVDQACVGLKMMAFSILAGLLIMAYYERQNQKQFNFIKCTGVLSGIVVLNILANLIRIVLLTIFEVLPQNPNHDIIGICCFLIYVIIPSYFLIKWVSGKMDIKKTDTAQKSTDFRNMTILNLFVFAAITTIGFVKLNMHGVINNQIPQISINGYTKEIVQGDVIKCEKTGILLYIKPLSKFYGAEHNPMICWTGSGYQFARINKQTIGDKEIYTGILKKGSDVIYSAWWFDNGRYQTIKQTDWRWRALKGDNFYLVNINSSDEKTLLHETNNLIAKNICTAK